MTTRNLLTGCGAGCLLTLVVAAVAGGLLFHEVKDTFGRFEDVAALQEDLRREHGAVADYVPPADGVVPAERLEVLLRVQADLQPSARALEDGVAAVRALEDGGPSPGKVVAAVKGIRSLGEAMGRLMHARNRALLDHGMGLGEYIYPSELIYHGWLGRPLRAELGKDPNFERTRMLREVFRGLLQRQRDAAQTAGDPSGIVPALESELTALAADLHYIPWSRGLPSVTEAGLAPYRARLEAVATDTGLVMAYGTDKEGGGFHFD